MTLTKYCQEHTSYRGIEDTGDWTSIDINNALRAKYKSFVNGEGFRLCDAVCLRTIERSDIVGPDEKFTAVKATHITLGSKLESFRSNLSIKTHSWGVVVKFDRKPHLWEFQLGQDLEHWKADVFFFNPIS